MATCNVTYEQIPGEVNGRNFGGQGVAGFLRYVENTCAEVVFESVCAEKRFAITPYHEILYNSFCKNSACDSSELICQGLKTINSSSYTESLNVVPFCGPTSLGSDLDLFLKTKPRLFDIVPLSCKVKFPLAVIFGIILTICCLFLNIGVILVARSSDSFQNAYGFYKISLAIADLLVGVFTAPVFTLTILYRGLMPAIDLNHLRTTYKTEIPSFGFPPIIFSLVGITGIITTVSILASVFTLSFSSIDRYFAIRFPFRYRRIMGKSLNTRIYFMIGFSWSLALVIAILPFIFPNSSYELSSSLLVVGTGRAFYTIYGKAILKLESSFLSLALDSLSEFRCFCLWLLCGQLIL